jgi:HK97 family phage major capsid protein
MPDRIYRYISVDRAKIDRAARTVPLSFSSETPALQRAEGLSPEMMRAAGLKEGEIYVEILDHEPANVDLSLLKNRGAFLDEHDDKDQIGVVEVCELADRQGRAIVKLDTHEKAETRLQQMENNSRPHISAGYRYSGFLKDEVLPNGRKAKRFAWKALEISSVAIPADATIGVARAYQDLPECPPSGTPAATTVDSLQSASAQHIFEKLSDEQKRSMRTLFGLSPLLLDPNPAGGGGAAGAVDEKVVRGNALAEERKRTKEIGDIADALIKDHGSRDSGKMADKIRGMAREAIAKDETIGDFKIRCMTDVLAAKPAEAVLIEDCTDAPEDYSLMRGIQSAVDRKARGMSPIPDGREGEVHQHILNLAKSRGGLGFEAEGFQVPANAPMRVGMQRSASRRKQRDMQASVFNAGGAFVPTQLLPGVIELLRNMSVLDRAGIRTMAGLQGNILIPRQEAASTAYAVAEIAALTASQQILGQIALGPKRVGATQTYSKQFIMQSAPDAEAFMRDDMLKVIALIWDRFGLNGQGAASEPLGLMNTPGIASIIFGATPTYIKLIAMRTALRKANVYDPLTVVSTPGTEGSLSGVAEALTGATTVGGAQNAIWKPGADQVEGRVIGCPAIASNQVPNDQVILGAFTHLIHAIWGGLDVVVDQFTKAGNAEVVLTFNTWGDFALRHPQAFCVSADSGAQ